MERNETISKYIIKLELDVEKMIQDFSGYIYTVIENNVGDKLSIEDKEEIMSDVFLTVWHNKEKIDNKRPLKYYMAGIAKNLIGNKLKKQKKYSNQVEFNDTELNTLEDIEIVCEQNQILEVISEELNNMKEKDYKVFAKFYYYSKSIKEIAEELGMTESNVGVRLHRIKKKLKKELDKRGFKYKNLLTIILILFVLTGVTLAVTYVTRNFINNRRGVDTAKEKGYIYEIETGNFAESNGIEIKVESVLMDDYNLEIIFEIKGENLEKNPNIGNFQFLNFLIIDENNKIIVADFANGKEYEKFCTEHGIKIEYKNISIADGSQSYKIIDKNENSHRCMFKAYSTNFPKSKQLKIKFDKINILDSKRNILDTLSGEWKMDISLPNSFSNRENIKYKVISCNDENFKVTKAEVSKTGMRIEIETVLEEKKTNLENLSDLEEQLRNPLIVEENECVITASGEKFYPIFLEHATGGYSREDNRKIYTLSNIRIN